MGLRDIDITKDKLYHETSAGGVLLYDKGGEKFVVTVERENVKDISLPKGHQEEGESLQETAIREIKEETGFDAVPLTYLGDFTYAVRTSEDSRVLRNVHWFLMKTNGGKPRKKNDEIKKVKLIKLNSDFSELSYDNDRMFIERAKEDISEKLK